MHRSRNSVADALLIELYATATRNADLTRNPHAFITSNSDDFSAPGGDKREPHVDIADMFVSEGSGYALGVDGLNSTLLAHFGEEIEELFAETYFEEEPRRLGEITDAEKALAFQHAYGALRRRIEAFVALPVESLDRIALQSAVDEIGRTTPEALA